jgi:hypothetical protein
LKQGDGTVVVLAKVLITINVIDKEIASCGVLCLPPFGSHGEMLLDTEAIGTEAELTV